MARGRPKKDDDELTGEDYIAGSYNVVRRDFYGDPGKNAGVGLTKEAAEAYKADREREGERCHYEVVAV